MIIVYPNLDESRPQTTEDGVVEEARNQEFQEVRSGVFRRTTSISNELNFSLSNLVARIMEFISNVVKAIGNLIFSNSHASSSNYSKEPIQICFTD
ncbi:hypothetical protein [Candidatus Neptunochlamydia vexilliferae]|uniref:Uncharacterized protein n=1 Tax=Candidatus Neptunichlamydia vexilliferae TaxID=1651774 RepID=A0ABS0B1N9_9BACT|nr:hypothetical protein [Candidatus Neptunochlamydia vexilliferae]MBF5059767.1 hypothetical protein [Candidatus Neptunochlamydia vexilliferae]